MSKDDEMSLDDENGFFQDEQDITETWCADAGFYCDHDYCLDCLYHT